MIHEPESRVRIPADVDRPDQILAALTARQLAILAAGACLAWAIIEAASAVVAFPWSLASGSPALVGAVILAFGERDGLTADRFVAAAWRHRREARHLVPADGPLPRPPSWLAAVDTEPHPAPLPVPVLDLTSDGTVEVGDGTSAMICHATAVNLSLASRTEQQSLVMAFGRWLNALQSPVQIVMRSEPMDATEAAEAVETDAARLDGPTLRAAALEHAAFMRELAVEQGLLRRRVLVVFTENATGPAGQTLLARRVEQAVDALRSAGVELVPLSRSDIAAELSHGQSQLRPTDAMAGPHDIIKGGDL